MYGKKKMAHGGKKKMMAHGGKKMRKQLMAHGGKKKSMYMKGGQAKLDMNKDGKLSGEDFKMLGNKGKKKAMKGMKMKYKHGGMLRQLD